MDSAGNLQLKWAEGYSGTKATFINQDTIIYSCGNFIKLVNISSKGSVCFPSPGAGVTCLTSSGAHSLFAFSEDCLNPNIYVYQFPGFKQRALLTDGAQLEYNDITFSVTGTYLAAFAGIPQYTLIIWNWADGSKLCSSTLSQIPVSDLTFNPINWRQLCATSPNQITLWNIEQSDNSFILQARDITLPWMSTVRQAESRGRPLTSTGDRAALTYTKSSLSLLSTSTSAAVEEKDNFISPLVHSWSPSGHVYVGCVDSVLLKVDVDSGKMVVESDKLISKQIPRTGSRERVVSTADETDDASGMSLTCMALSREGLFVGTEDGNVYSVDINSKDLTVIPRHLGNGPPISSLVCSPSYNTLAIGTETGCLSVLSPAEQNSVIELINVDTGRFIGLDMVSVGTQHCVSARENGSVQIWSVDDCTIVATLDLQCPITSMQACPSSNTIIVGAKSGHVYFIDASMSEHIRIVKRMHLHQGPVLHIKFDPSGQFFITGSTDECVYVVDAKPSSQFNCHGYFTIDGEMKAIDCVTSSQGSNITNVVILSNTQPDDINLASGATRLTQIQINDRMLTGNPDAYDNLKKQFKDEELKKFFVNLTALSMGVAVTSNGRIFTQVHTKALQELTLNPADHTESERKIANLFPDNEYPGHDMVGTAMTLSGHRKWLALASKDGSVSVRDVDNLDKCMKLPVHSLRAGGVSHVVFTSDGQNLITAGLDGVIACHQFIFTPSGRNKSAQAVEHARARNSALRGYRQREDGVLQGMDTWTPSTEQQQQQQQQDDVEEKDMVVNNDEIFVTPLPTLPSDPTWLDEQNISAITEEDKQYHDVKQEIRDEIHGLRQTIHTMMNKNETVPDIEKLSRPEFNLDVDELAKLHQDSDNSVQTLKDDIEFENLATLYMRELIKKECWDSMTVKGVHLKAFTGDLEVANYPMKELTKEDKDELEEVTRLRRVQVADMSSRKQIVETTEKTKPSDYKLLDDDDEIPGDEETGDVTELPATTGSLGVNYGGGNDLFYSQFELHGREQKHAQIILLKDAIYRLKMAFNKEFDEVYRAKEQEMTRIYEKNVRIQKILRDLNLKEDVWVPSWNVVEKPELLLKVEDSEVKVEKFLSPEQRAHEEEVAKIEEQRRLAEKADNWRDRGLDWMMGGVLEIKKEDELKKDVPVPSFASKPQEEWSEDELKAYKDYERRVKELEEERIKYHKQLESELKKLQSSITDGTNSFHEHLQQLFNRKVKTEMVLFQEELKILRFNYSLLLEAEILEKESTLNRELDTLKQKKIQNSGAVLQSRKQLDFFKESYEILVAEDKVMEKAFKRDFSDLPASQVDQLFKLYRRRPRGPKTLKSTIDLDPNSQNPFSDRPLSARQLGNQAHQVLMRALDELDDELHIPEGVELQTWQRLCSARRAKICSEQQVKQKALTLADMNAFLQRRVEDDQDTITEMERISTDLIRLRETKTKLMCDLEVQLLLKQGQVEVNDGTFVPDYSNSILIHRNVVEDLNGKIRTLGKVKISSMNETKDFRKGIHQLDWDRKRLIMQIEDLQTQCRDIQLLRVTKELQVFLNEKNHESRKQQELQILESTLQLQNKKLDKRVNEYKATLKELHRTIKKKEYDNTDLDLQLRELNVVVAERGHIHEVTADKKLETSAERRMQDIVQRRKLVELAKAQAQEVAVLRAEVERLRMRTFPALVQVEH